MNAVEIEQAVSALAEAPFDRAEFPFAFLQAFGNKETTLRKLRVGAANKSDVPGALLQQNNIHLAVCDPGLVSQTLTTLRASPATTRYKAKFILATDGQELQAEPLFGDVPPLACAYTDLPNHFAFFLPLAGITTVRQIAENAFDIRATGRLNRLYVELLKTNPDWDTNARREELNHFFARLIFCFFAEDTGIFDGTQLFTGTVETMTERDGSNTHEVLSELFRAMNMRKEDRAASDLRPWAMKFPYVNGNLFSGSVETPRFSKIARSYLLFVGGLDWKKINPDIFGSMIQAVADDEERGALGMHYTSVPNILKVLNPLFLDDLRQKLEEAGDGSTPASKGQLKRLRDRLSRIRVFDPACGSGNFLVIAYKEMRLIEAVINERRGEYGNASVIPIRNFRGIEIRHFAAEIARLALIVAEYQCNVLHRGLVAARGEVIPLKSGNWITRGNALRLDWLDVMDECGTGVKVTGDDLFNTPLDQVEIDFENAAGETYICGNPPYLGSKWQTDDQKLDLRDVCVGHAEGWKSLDYVSGWLLKAASYATHTDSASAFVSTNSICQGLQVTLLWPGIFATGSEILFAHTSFKWSNLASQNAGVTVVIIGLKRLAGKERKLFAVDDDGKTSVKVVGNINAYLVAQPNVWVEQARVPSAALSTMLFGNMPRDGGNFVLTDTEKHDTIRKYPELRPFIRRFLGSEEMIQGKSRWCVWIDEPDVCFAENHPFLRRVLNSVKIFRSISAAASTREFARRPHRFVQIAGTATDHSLAVAKVSSENRPYLPVDLLDGNTIVSDLLFALYDAPLWNMSIIASKLHLVWIATVCGKLETRYRYSNTLGWNTFPPPREGFSESNRAELTMRAEEILLAREAHFPATIADLYNPERMKKEFPDLLAAHDRNDETLERIYIGRRFRNDTERLEKLFELYTQMTAKAAMVPTTPKRPRKSDRPVA